MIQKWNRNPPNIRIKNYPDRDPDQVSTRDKFQDPDRDLKRNPDNFAPCRRGIKESVFTVDD